MATPDTEVRPRAKHRTFTAEYKARIVDEYLNSTPEAKAAILRREGLYTSHLSMWRKLTEGKTSDAPPRHRRERESSGELARLRKENAKLQRRLAKAEQLNEALGKATALLQASINESADEMDEARSRRA